jgi:uncharacterized C2H2 Zn-finger protein
MATSKIIGYYGNSANKSYAKYLRNACGIKKTRAQRIDKGIKRKKY